MKQFIILFVFSLFVGQGFTQQKEKVPNITEYTDLVYGKVGDWEGRVDVYTPRSNKKTALVVYIHGGGWTHGAKEREYDKFRVFLEHGYAVANIAYRLAGQAPAPAALEDINAAIQFVLARAEQYNIDLNRVVLMGGSAGAHLALVAGLQSNQPQFTGRFPSKPFVVSAMISKYGPTDLLTWETLKKPNSASLTWFGDRVQDTLFRKSLSPYHIFDNQKIPILFVHGDADKSVSIQQSYMLFHKLQKRNVMTEMFVVEKGGHGNFGPVETPKMDAAMIDFLRRVLW